jgi:aryl-alcohol dehydrogenase-like predicted oxidoreductase
VPRVGVGCWAIGGVDYGEVYDHVSIAGLRLAYEMGARVFDTAIAYGWGRSERVLGRALGNADDAVFVTKFGPPAEQLSPGMIRASIDTSRFNLMRDRIDLALFHLNGYDPGQAGFVFDTIAELRTRGWIGAFGWSTDAPASVRAFADRDGFVAIENDFNVFMPADELMQLASEKNLVSISRLPLAMGMLTGKYSDGRAVGDSDIRASGVDWMVFFKDGKAHPDYLRRLESLRELLTTGGRTLAQGALSWILARSPIALPVPGFKTEAQIRDNLGVLEKGPLPAAIMDEIDTVLGRSPARR